MRICRLCATAQSKGVLLCDHGNKPWDKLVKSILAYLDLKCTETDQLPKYLCTTCQLAAESTHKFLCVVKAAQFKLRADSTAKHELEFEFIAPFAEMAPNQNALKEIKISNKRVGKTSTQLDKQPAKLAKIEETVAAAQAPEPALALGRLKRIRRAPKRFLDEVELHATSALTHTLTSQLYKKHQQQQLDDDACAIITTAPIAELRTAFGISMAEVIEVNTTKKTPICHSKLRLICDYCKEVFNKQNAFLKHVRTHRNCVYECSECLENFSTKTEFESHQSARQHSGLGIIENASTSAVAETDEHNDADADLNDSSPPPPPQAAINIVVGANGQITHIDETNLVEDSNPNTNIRLAKKTLKTGGSYACLKCEKMFADHYAVRRHYRQVHEASQPFKCRQCDACFKTKSSFNYHMAKHTGQKPHLCSTCAKSFIFKYELTLHMRVHTGDQPYKCQQCEKAFSHRSNLVVHQRLHAGLRPFKCAKCEACFNSTSHLNAHKKVHLKQAQAEIARKETSAIASATQSFEAEKADRPEEFLAYNLPGSTKSTKPNTPSQTTPNASVSLLKPKSTILSNTTKSLQSTQSQPSLIKPADYRHQCQQCYKYFKQKSTLDKHMRTHTGDKPYKCPSCPKAFADASNFKKHKLLHKNASNELRNVKTQFSVSATSAFKQQMWRREMANGSGSNSCDTASNNTSIQSQTILETLEVDTEAGLRQFFNENAAAVGTASLLNDANQIVCITYQDPSKPLDCSELTTFYVAN